MAFFCCGDAVFTDGVAMTEIIIAVSIGALIGGVLGIRSVVKQAGGRIVRADSDGVAK